MVFFILPYSAALMGGGGRVLWENASIFKVALFTVQQAVLSTILALALGLPGAWLVSRESRASVFLRSVTAIPFAMPSILVVLGFVLFFGNSGWVNRFFMAISGEKEGPLRILYRPEAIILAHGFYNFPLIIRLVGDGLNRARKAYGPAAASLGASPFISSLTVLLPLALPSLMAALLLVFLYSFTSFAVVLVLGGGPAATTLAVEIYRYARLSLDMQSAGALAGVETLIALTVFAAYLFFERKTRGLVSDIRDRSVEPGKQRRSLLMDAFLVLYGLFMAALALGPLVSVLVESLLYKPSRAAFPVISLRWWRALGEQSVPALGRSLFLAFSSATVACVLGALAAGAAKLADLRKTGHSAMPALIRLFVSAPLVSSGVVLGLGYLILYGREQSRSFWAVVMIHAVTGLPFAFNAISEGLRSLPPSTLYAAEVSGASPLKALLTVAIPLSGRRLRSAWGFSAAISLGELNALLILGIDYETLPLLIYRATGAYRYGTACAAGVLLMASCAIAMVLSEVTFLNKASQHKQHKV
ncbi:MAG: iron ABC transporter permease [Treponema sp.]|jgi:thiamine transport system permease protein|nr:iron ABC transporter permease [Treponema sp.]